MGTGEKLAKLEKRLKGAAYKRASNLETAEDVYNNMVVAILERASAEPDFINQQDAYIVNYAAWVGGNHKRDRQAVYEKYVSSLDDDALELAAGAGPSAEIEQERGEMIAAMVEAIGAMNPGNQAVVTMLYQGYREKEIAQALGISQAAVTQRKGTIRKRLAALVQ